MDNVDAGIVALAVSIAFFTNGGVDIVKRVVGRSRHRRWLLPIAGLVLGWIFAALILTYREEPWSAKTVSGVILAGCAAAILAAMSNDQSKQAEGDGRG